MKNVTLMILLFALALNAMSKKVSHHNENGIDDWEYNATIVNKTKSPRTMVAMSSPMMKSIQMDNLGFSVGGAKDADNFYQNIKNGYLPKLKSITYEGVFYDHYFNNLKFSECKELFCPSFTTLKRKNLYNKKDEYYLLTTLNSNIKASDFKRKKLNIVIVLDISGSMSTPFDRYYYDKRDGKKENSNLSKMEIATKSIVNMIDHLKDDDRFGMVLFDNTAYDAKPLREIKTTNIDAIKKHILDLKSRGGTNWSEGYKRGVSYFNNLKEKLKDPNVYENRVIFLTDAMPNRGELSENGLFGLVKKASQNKIYTTFIGVGVDFNTDLVEAVSKTEGANYYSVHSEKEFKKRMDDEFDYMVTPLVFDLKLELLTDKNEIEAVYGSPQANEATSQLMSVNTLFPSPTKNGKTKGGIILVKLKNQNPVKLKLSYKTRSSIVKESIKDVIFKDEKNKTAKKAILLTDYVTLMKNYLLDARASCHDHVKIDGDIYILKQRAFLYPPTRDIYPYISQWERRSCPLKVSDGYKKLFSLFYDHFNHEITQFSDDNFNKELNALKHLKDYSLKIEKTKVDDWKTRR